MKFSLIIILFSITVTGFAQLPTGTDIWLMDMKFENKKFTFSNSQNITNRNGYDNQPAFSPDNKFIYFTSVREDEQSDIYKYEIKSKVISQFTKTPTSEYSPTFMKDGKNISVVMVEKDSTQRLWMFSLKDSKPTLLLKNVDSVGYHTWINKDSLALFILGNPNTLQLVNIHTHKPKVFAKEIGRSIRLKNQTLFFTSVIDSVNWICRLDKKNHLGPVVKCINESQDFILFKNFILISSASMLYSFDIEKKSNHEWNEVANFTKEGLTEITRFTISSDGKKIALVSNKKEDGAK